MKKLIALIIVLVAGYLVYDRLIKVKSTEQERRVEALVAEFEEAEKDLGQAGVAAGAAGMDSTSDADSALAEVAEVKRKLDLLLPELTEEKARQKADGLRRELDRFQSQHR